MEPDSIIEGIQDDAAQSAVSSAVAGIESTIIAGDSVIAEQVASVNEQATEISEDLDELEIVCADVRQIVTGNSRHLLTIQESQATQTGMLNLLMTQLVEIVQLWNQSQPPPNLNESTESPSLIPIAEPESNQSDAEDLPVTEPVKDERTLRKVRKI